MRVYEIAKEVGIPNKELLAKIRALGLEVNNHMSSLNADDVARIKKSLERERSMAGQSPQETHKLSTGTVLRRRQLRRRGRRDADDHRHSQAKRQYFHNDLCALRLCVLCCLCVLV